MSEFNIEVEGGSSVRLPTAGKYCDRDIVVTATGGGMEVFQNPTYGTYYVADMVVNSSSLSFGNLAGSPNLKSFTLNGVKEIGYGSGTNILAYCPNLKSICLPDLYLLNSWFCGECKALETIQVGSVGVPVTLLRATNPFSGCTQNGLTITVYVDAILLADIEPNVIKNAPWGAINATIVYRNSTTGEVITE
jgi:hypothetical protein